MKRQYKEDNLVAIKRTQLSPGLKLANKYLKPYITKVLLNDYIVQKVSEYEGSLKMSICWLHEAMNRNLQATIREEMSTKAKTFKNECCRMVEWCL